MDISFRRESNNTLVISLGGRWSINDGLPSVEKLRKQIESAPPLELVAFDARELGDWDSSLLDLPDQS